MRSSWRPRAEIPVRTTAGWRSIRPATTSRSPLRRCGNGFGGGRGQCPPLRWKLVTVPFGLDRPVFVATEVNLDDHVSETTLAAPADETTLAAEVAKTLSTPLDRAKPLWKLQVFHGLPGRTAVLMTLHHAAADGIAAGEIFATLLDWPDEKSPAPSGTKVDAAPGRAVLAARGIASIPGRRVRSLR